MWSEMIGWVGMVLSIVTTVPQFVKSAREKSTKGLSLMAYQVLFAAMACYLVRAIVIKDPVFIISSVINLILTLGMLYLFQKYPESKMDNETTQGCRESGVN
jgi:uncharacterized protein with PQ loop repeat